MLPQLLHSHWVAKLSLLQRHRYHVHLVHLRDHCRRQQQCYCHRDHPLDPQLRSLCLLNLYLLHPQKKNPRRNPKKNCLRLDHIQNCSVCFIRHPLHCYPDYHHRRACFSQLCCFQHRQCLSHCCHWHCCKTLCYHYCHYIQSPYLLQYLLCLPFNLWMESCQSIDWRKPSSLDDDHARQYLVGSTNGSNVAPRRNAPNLPVRRNAPHSPTRSSYVA